MVKRPPPVFPAGLDFLDASIGEGCCDAFGSFAVGGELDAIAAFGVLEPLGRELDEVRAQGLGLCERSADDRLDQRNAWRSFSKKPSSAL
jgi:hypothetical protein